MIGLNRAQSFEQNSWIPDLAQINQCFRCEPLNPCLLDKPTSQQSMLSQVQIKTFEHHRRFSSPTPPSLGKVKMWFLEHQNLPFWFFKDTDTSDGAINELFYINMDRSPTEKKICKENYSSKQTIV